METSARGRLRAPAESARVTGRLHGIRRGATLRETILDHLAWRRDTLRARAAVPRTNRRLHGHDVQICGSLSRLTPSRRDSAGHRSPTLESGVRSDASTDSRREMLATIEPLVRPPAHIRTQDPRRPREQRPVEAPRWRKRCELRALVTSCAASRMLIISFLR
jgi:hypothetical protein